MSAVKRKLKTLSLGEKLEVLEAVKKCQKKKDVAKKFGLPMSTLSTIIKNGAKIIEKIQNGQNLSSRRRRIAEFPEMEECLLKWIEQCRYQNIRISGSLLQEKAKMSSKSLGKTNFRASNGWLEKFKRRHAHVFIGCEENASVSVETSNKCKSELQDLDHFVISNDGDMTSGTDDEIIDSLPLKTETNELDDTEIKREDNTTFVPWVSTKEAWSALNTLRNFIEQSGFSGEQEFTALYTLENAIIKQQHNCLKQEID